MFNEDWDQNLSPCKKKKKLSPHKIHYNLKKSRQKYHFGHYILVAVYYIQFAINFC